MGRGLTEERNPGLARNPTSSHVQVGRGRDGTCHDGQRPAVNTQHEACRGLPPVRPEGGTREPSSPPLPPQSSGASAWNAACPPYRLTAHVIAFPGWWLIAVEYLGWVTGPHPHCLWLSERKPFIWGVNSSQIRMFSTQCCM